MNQKLIHTTNQPGLVIASHHSLLSPSHHHTCITSYSSSLTITIIFSFSHHHITTVSLHHILSLTIRHLHSPFTITSPHSHHIILFPSHYHNTTLLSPSQSYSPPLTPKHYCDLKEPTHINTD